MSPNAFQTLTVIDIRAKVAVSVQRDRPALSGFLNQIFEGVYVGFIKDCVRTRIQPMSLER
jgi:hypothetical protein